MGINYHKNRLDSGFIPFFLHHELSALLKETDELVG